MHQYCYIKTEVSRLVLQVCQSLTHLFPMHHFSTPMFSGGREKMYWEQIFFVTLNPFQATGFFLHSLKTQKENSALR